MEVLYVLHFLSTFERLILISQSQMVSYLMWLQTFSLLVNCWKFIIQNFHLCVRLNTLYLYFSMMFQKSQLWTRWLNPTRQYSTYLVLEYITNLILYSNQNHMSSTIVTLVYLVATIPEWLFISFEWTDFCTWEKHFLPQFFLLNSTLFH